MSVVRWMDKETMEHIYSGILLSHKKEHIWVTSNEVGEPRACCTEWSKSEREKQMSYINAYTWNLERWYWWIYFQDNSGDTDIENKRMDTGRVGGGRRGWYEWREYRGSTYTTICNVGNQWAFAVWLRELTPGLCNHQEWGWGRRWEARYRGRGHMYSHSWSVDMWHGPTQYCEENFPQLKINEFGKIKPLWHFKEELPSQVWLWSVADRSGTNKQTALMWCILLRFIHHRFKPKTI